MSIPTLDIQQKNTGGKVNLSSLMLTAKILQVYPLL